MASFVVISIVLFKLNKNFANEVRYIDRGFIVCYIDQRFIVRSSLGDYLDFNWKKTCILLKKKHNFNLNFYRKLSIVHKSTFIWFLYVVYVLYILFPFLNQKNNQLHFFLQLNYVKHCIINKRFFWLKHFIEYNMLMFSKKKQTKK